MKDKLHIRFSGCWFLFWQPPAFICSCTNTIINIPGPRSSWPMVFLILSEKELQTDPVRFLKLAGPFIQTSYCLPEDFSDGIPDSYQFYTQIGQRSHFHSYSLPDNPHGYGTYVLWLSLPAEQSYTLELPEIFSACRLYVDDQLVLTLGDPDPAHYIPCIQERLITFTSTGMTRLILCVSDYSHYYSGMVYPPAFGLSHNVELYHNLRIGICIAFESLALLIAVLAIFLGLHSHQKNILIFAVLCISIIGFTAYPLFHTFLIVPVSSLVLSGIVLWICSGLAGTGTPQPPVLNGSASMPDQSGNRTDRLYHCPMLWTDLCLFDNPCHERFFHPTNWYKAFCVPLSAELLRRCTFPPPAGYTGTVLRRCILRNRFSVGSAASLL